MVCLQYLIYLSQKKHILKIKHGYAVKSSQSFFQINQKAAIDYSDLQ